MRGLAGRSRSLGKCPRKICSGPAPLSSLAVSYQPWGEQPSSHAPVTKLFCLILDPKQWVQPIGPLKVQIQWRFAPFNFSSHGFGTAARADGHLHPSEGPYLNFNRNHKTWGFWINHHVVEFTIHWNKGLSSRHWRVCVLELPKNKPGPCDLL